MAHSEDQRVKIETLFQRFGQLKEEWICEFITNQKGYPINAYRTQHKGPAIWIIAGIHGEEVAGPLALSLSIDLLVKFGQKCPMVIIPMCNPFGYVHEMRYPDGGHSVGDNEWLLRENVQRPILPEAQVLSFYILEKCLQYPPMAVIDLHEDLLSKQSYLYTYNHNPLTQVALTALNVAGCQILSKGITRFGEKINKGVVLSSHDGSIDELMSSPYILRNGKKIKGPNVETVLVIETPGSLPLSQRITTHIIVLNTLLDIMCPD